jgi:Mce-associated membrane protein
VVTTNAGEPEAEPRHWRMRVAVKKVGDEAKVSNVAFVQ